jgi:hypothetical protein
MNKTRIFLVTAILLILSVVFFGCETDTDNGNGKGGGISVGDTDIGVDTVVGSAIYYSGNNIPFITGYKWNYNDVNGNFLYTFEPQGSIGAVSAIDGSGCCCAGGGTFLINGNVLITWFDKGMYEGIQVTNIDIAKDESSFTRVFGTGEKGDTYIKGGKLSTSSSAMNISNSLVGTWNGDDGKTYVFNKDSTLKINTDTYGYFVRNSKLVYFGPLIDGKAVKVSTVYDIGVLATKTKLGYKDGKLDEKGKEITEYITLTK